MSQPCCLGAEIPNYGHSRNCPSQNSNKHIPLPKCEICETNDVAFATATECTNCWEVTRRLEEFARSVKGQEILRRHINDQA